MISRNRSPNPAWLRLTCLRLPPKRTAGSRTAAPSPATAGRAERDRAVRAEIRPAARRSGLIWAFRGGPDETHSSGSDVDGPAGARRGDRRRPSLQEAGRAGGRLAGHGPVERGADRLGNDGGEI